MPDPTFTLSDLRALIDTAAAKSERTVEEALAAMLREFPLTLAADAAQR